MLKKMILADDHSRVQLKKKQSDYVNANYIDVSIFTVIINLTKINKTIKSTIGLITISFIVF